MPTGLMERYNEEIFENIKHVNEFEQEFWYARELQKVLNYSQWRRFETAISRAMDTCKNSGNDIEEHFAQVRNMVAFSNRNSRVYITKPL